MRNKPKILHTMTWLAPGGGVDNNVYLAISGLREEFDFHFAVGGQIHKNDFEKIKGLKIYVCKDLVRQINPLKDLKALYYFWKLIRKEKYDIVHTHETKASFISRIAAHAAGCKYIIYGLHGVTFNDPHSRIRGFIYTFLNLLMYHMTHYV